MSRSTRRSLFGFVVVAAAMLPGPAEGQTRVQERERRGPVSAYAFAGWGPYARRHEVQTIGEVTERGAMPLFGWGVGWQPMKLFSASAEAGFAAYGGYPQPMTSINASGYFRDARDRGRALAPFVTGGYSLIADRETKLNVGAGVSYWFKGGVGVRVEARHLFAPRRKPVSGTLTSYSQVRVGLSFGRFGSR